jgi:hypothetical protein
MGDYRQLAVWKRAYALTAEIYRSTRPFPDSERYGLTSQMRRAAISILSNIAEGSGRQTDREQVRFLRDVGYLKPGDWLILDSDCREVGRMLTGLIKSLQSRQ